MAEKTYANGRIYKLEDFKLAKQVLIKDGIYQKLGNFGPYNKFKTSLLSKTVKTFRKSGFEFIIQEVEVMNFSLSSLNVSKPTIERVAWFQRYM